MTGSSRIKGLAAIVFLVCAGPVFSAPFVSAEPIEARHYLGDMAELKGWSGLEKAPGAGREGRDAARLDIPGETTFRYPEEKPADWYNWPILAMEVQVPENVEEVELSLSLIGGDARVRSDVNVQLAESGWRSIRVPVQDFRLNKAVVPAYLSRVKGIRIKANVPGNKDNQALLLNKVRLQRGRSVGLMVPITSKPGDPGETIEYDAIVANCTEERRAVSLRLEPQGGAVMVTTVEPREVSLDPGETREVTVRAEIPKADMPGVSGALPRGARERWTLKAIPGGRSDLAEEQELIHVVRMKSPYIIHTKEKWDRIRKLAETEDWAKKQAENIIENARNTKAADNPLAVAKGWQLSRDKELAERVADHLRGFKTTIKEVRQGGLLERKRRHRNLARAYDMVRDASVFTEEEKQEIEVEFRTFLDAARRMVKGVGNQPLSMVNSALLTALAIQDWHWVERFLEGPCGIEWQIRRGIMDDGWWWEMSTNYNLWSASMLTKAGLAMRPWGVEVLEDKYPAVYHESLEVSAQPGKSAGPWHAPEAGMFASVWGPSYRTYRQVRDLWDSLIPLINEDGKVPGLNDAYWEQDAGRFNLAAYAYEDPDYLRHASGENLMYPVDVSGVNQEEDKLLPNVVADNAGVAMLRSQGVDTPRQQYQSLLSYGSHGAHHGHWNRLNLTYLRRFGKLATHQRTAWFGYNSIMYQMYVQTSMAHSMPIVDGKNQYPAPSTPLLRHTGELFQAVAVENESRWSNPRFAGHKGYTEQDKEAGVIDTGHVTIQMPEDPPAPGNMSEFTEPIRSRRLMAVTDEYVLVGDNVQGEKEHTFDCLYQFRGFREFNEGADIEFLKERENWSDSPLKAGQFVSDARIYEAEGPVRATFVSGYKPGQHRPRPVVKDGWDSMTIDVYTAWPQQRKHIVAKNPKGWNTYSAARTKGHEANFVTLIELQEDPANRQVASVTGDSPEQITVTLANGRTHHWRVDGLDAEQDRTSSVKLKMTEKSADGKQISSERAE